MKVDKLYKSANSPVISFEFFPPRNEDACVKLEKVLDKLLACNPSYVTVTYGAGGSTSDGSYKLVENLIKNRKCDVVPYFAGFGSGQEEIKKAVERYVNIGAETLFVIRGDDPGEGFKKHPEAFSYASDLIKYIRSFSPQSCIGAAGYPEGHKEAVSLDMDIEHVKLKLNNGSSYLVTQFFYDNNYYFDFVKRCRAAGIECPIVPGIMPIYSVKLMENLAKVCGATITDNVRNGLKTISTDNNKEVAAFGVEFAVRQCKELLDANVPGLHFYTMNRSKSICEILSRIL